MTQQAHMAQDWASLTSGDPVMVKELNGRKYPAQVDIKTADSTILWVFDDFGHRRAFEHCDGTAITKRI